MHKIQVSIKVLRIPGSNNTEHQIAKDWKVLDSWIIVKEFTTLTKLQKIHLNRNATILCVKYNIDISWHLPSSFVNKQLCWFSSQPQLMRALTHKCYFAHRSCASLYFDSVDWNCLSAGFCLEMYCNTKLNFCSLYDYCLIGLFYGSATILYLETILKYTHDFAHFNFHRWFFSFNLQTL